MKLQEETPVIGVIEPATIPKEKSERKIFLIILTYFMLGIFAGFVLIFGISKWGEINLKLKD